MLRRLFAESIWHPDALPQRERKYRSLKRFWLPAYDVFAIVAGVNAALFGSRLLDRIYGDFTDVIGVIFAIVALVCLIGVGFPRLWAMEMVGKSLMVGMIVAYIAAIILVPSPEQIAVTDQPNWFIVAMLCYGLPLALFRLTLLGEERWERKVLIQAGAAGAD